MMRNVQWFRGGLVFKAYRLCVSLNSRLESNKKEEKGGSSAPGKCRASNRGRQPRHTGPPPPPNPGGCMLDDPRRAEHPFPPILNLRGGLVFKAHRRLYHSTLGLRVVRKKKKILNLRYHQPSEWDQIACFSSLDLYWTSPESGATVVQITRLGKEGLVLLGGLVVCTAPRAIRSAALPVQGYLAHKKLPPPGTLQ